MFPISVHTNAIARLTFRRARARAAACIYRQQHRCLLPRSPAISCESDAPGLDELTCVHGQGLGAPMLPQHQHSQNILSGTDAAPFVADGLQSRPYDCTNLDEATSHALSNGAQMASFVDCTCDVVYIVPVPGRVSPLIRVICLELDDKFVCQLNDQSHRALKVRLANAP